ncbi:hypothetical protein OG21DRAFT_111755 [Imleria badia]|nr:hypothetical protein OG21DRAFT_111755 [Imleria badia]
MFTPYRFDSCHALNNLNSMFEIENHISANEYHSLSGVTTEDHGFGTQLEDIMQSSAGAPSGGTNVFWSPVPRIDMSTLEPMSPRSRIVLDREVETLFGTVSDATGAIRIPSNEVFLVMENHAPDTGFDNATQTPENAHMIEAHSLVNTTQISHSCLEEVPCQWTGEGISETCGAQITCRSVPAHLGNIHSIRKLPEDALIYCWWQECHRQVKRKNFVRHIRERHLHHLRSIILEQGHTPP